MTARAHPVFDLRVARALEHGHLVEITTHGRQTGQARRVQLGFHNVEGRIYISGRPGRRGWYANLLANPQFVFHLADAVVADLPATARPIIDPQERRDVLPKIAAGWGYDLELMVANSPLIEVSFEPGVR